MTKERILASKRATQIFLAVLTVIAVLALVLSEAILPNLAKKSVLTGDYNSAWAELLATACIIVVQVCLTSLLLCVAYLVLVPKDARLGEVVVLEGADVGNSLREFVHSTDRYWFRGRSARWVRTSVFPVLADRASSERKRIEIRIALPNPANQKLMNDYADYRNSLAPQGREEEWTGGLVVTNVLAAIVSVYHHAAGTKFFDPTVGLADWFPAYRLDITEHSAVMTTEKKDAPTLRFKSSSSFFATLVAEVEHTIEQGSTLPKPDAEFRGRALDEAFVNDILAHLDLSGQLTDQVTAANVLEKATSADGTYGRT